MDFIGSRGENRRTVKDVLEGVAGQAAEDQLLLAQQALAQIRESVVITETELEEPGPAIVYVNAAFTKMTGWLPEEVTGRSPRFLQGPKTTRKLSTVCGANSNEAKHSKAKTSTTAKMVRSFGSIGISSRCTARTVKSLTG